MSTSSSDRPTLVVVVDTEEEFDWSKPFDRRNRGVSHMRSIERFQSVCDRSGVRPVYVIDHPIASSADSIEPLRAIHDDGRCEIGAHLHPWVTPPFDEEVNARNSYPGNLPRELECAKLAELVRTIERSFGRRPTAYKAGRYGFGPRTESVLVELGFEVDLSPCPPFDLRGDGGPDWRAAPVEPRWIGTRERPILQLANTGAFVGWLGASGSSAYDAAQSSLGRTLHLGGVLARIGAVERLFLSPEGYAPADLERLTRALIARGVRTFVLSLHSPSVVPGHTPYVRDDADLKRLLDACTSYFELFLGQLGGVARTATDLARERRATRDVP